MLRKYFLLLVSVVIFVGCSQEKELSITKLESTEGIPFTLIHVPENPDVTIQIAWPTNWANRNDVNQAIPFIGTRMILEGGAEGYAPGQAGEIIKDLNSEGHLVPTIDHILGQITYPRDKATETLKIANAHLRAPLMKEKSFNRLRNDFRNHIQGMGAQPLHKGFNVVRRAVFGNQPIREALSLDASDQFSNIERSDIIEWHKETISTAPSAIVIAGALKDDVAKAQIDQLFAGLNTTSAKKYQVTSADFSPKRILMHDPNANTTQLSFIAPIPATRLGNEFEDLLIVGALGQGENSVLFETVRTKLRAAYGFEAGIVNYTREQRILYMTGIVDGDKLDDTERAILEAYTDFRTNGPSGDLEALKAPLDKRFEELPNFVIDVSQAQIQSELDDYPLDRMLKIRQELELATHNKILQRLQKDYPKSIEFIVVAVSPDVKALSGACVITSVEQVDNCQ